jgi:predicted short-subunit dehydrogenase-like oxidoreductase (DUF2520 family)
MDLPKAPYRVALVGAGRVGVAVCALLVERGHRIVSVSSRSESSAAAAAERLQSHVGEPEDADAILVGAPEPALSQAIAGISSPAPVVHFAGVVGIEPFRRDAGPVLALHPVQACPDVDTAIERLPGCAWGVTCDDDVRPWAHSLVRELEGRPVDVAEGDRAAWHAAAVATSNGIAALMATGEAILESLGVAEPEAVLGPISAATVANAREGGGGAATLTGPVVRGEVETVRRHLAALSSRPELLDAYVDVARVILHGARRSGRVDPTALDRIERSLSS